jgi:hypothetical protein
VFAGSNGKGCKRKVHARDSLAVSRCGCPGYLATSGSLARAEFATLDVPLVDTVTPKLRIVNPPGTQS